MRTPSRRSGELDGLGKRQRIYAVRFIGPLGYVVTFQQMDPLHARPTRSGRPRIAGTLELTGYSAYLHPAADRTLIGDRPRGHRTGSATRHADLTVRRKQPGRSAAARPPRQNQRPIQRRIGPTRVPLLATDRHRGTTGELVDERAGERRRARAQRRPQPDHRTRHHHPADNTPDAGQAGITRSLIIGTDLWTVSDGGLMVNDLATLSSQAWIPNQ